MRRLNKNDYMLLAFCSSGERSINETARYLGISPSSTSLKVKSLVKDGYLKLIRQGKGKRAIIKVIGVHNYNRVEINALAIEILKHLGNGMTKEEFIAMYECLNFKASNENRPRQPENYMLFLSYMLANGYIALKYVRTNKGDMLLKAKKPKR